MNIKNIKIHGSPRELPALQAYRQPQHQVLAIRTDIDIEEQGNLTHGLSSLIKIDGVESTEAANFYLGKKVAFVYRAKREVRGSNIRVIWGKVTRPHGNSGVVRAQFRHNLPPKTFGATVRVMLYPSNI
ncbi:60S ribosomal protein L35Ae [Aspergillus costaricaensis CBS 115574]|uniref:60S ribosomal protein L35Ae n=1 Tax=Aspergillus costaricaensis CBS 115574 TaxID=1448317 RepID=A0ACD1IAR4_9EURO|nr:60S ribosomal protein L35Ae [Aspergillus costaricaensis CBS 115574]RAK86857.1 60S ribosomal protein L35Ae [Aspergillus costaricaensis CBS 115574]GAA84402.1 60S ribosomal protein L35Ae [Aspergillus luchuensis IFO 4308]